VNQGKGLLNQIAAIRRGTPHSPVITLFFSIWLRINLTPYVPLSFKGEGEGSFIREASPLFDSPYTRIIKGVLEGLCPSNKLSSPSP
jgi:hypothetical protein